MTRSTFSAATDVAVILILCLVSVARAAVPASLNYQGFLTDAAGLPIDDSVVVTFSIYTTEDAVTAVWSDDLLVTVDQGLFSVELGSDGTFPPGMFDTPLYLGVTIAGDTEMLPRRPLTSVGFSFKADDAWSLRGQGPAVFDQSGHVANTANPHDVTAAQTGAASAVDIAGLQSQLDAALAAISQLETDLANETSTRIAAVSAESNSRIAADTAEAAARTAADGVHDTAIAAIQSNTVLSLNGVLTRPDAGTAQFSGVNLQVVNGTGSTDGPPNGTGNVLIGYNGASPSGNAICSLGEFTSQSTCEDQNGVWAVVHKSGSHNLVIGDHHNYSRYGGLVVGADNDITGVFASVTGGLFNTASGDAASVSGGSDNVAGDLYTSVSGGYQNTASDRHASVSGGHSNDASGNYSSVSGGGNNTASGDYSSVSGGGNNTASGDYASVSGGGSDQPADSNHAYANYASILGGAENIAGDPDSGDRTIGSSSSIAGGDSNRTTGMFSSVSGGGYNIAQGRASSITSGHDNLASGDFSSVSGGGFSTASGYRSSVSGGRQNSASDWDSSVSGGLANTASGDHSSVSGGYSNTASGSGSSISGGLNNTGSGNYSSVAGGGGLDSTDGNEAFADYSAILGGRENVTGDPASEDNEIGVASTVGGGLRNNAQGLHASVSGGQENTASGTEASVSGGVGNIASGNNAAVSGGMNNIAHGFNASVTGGQENIASGTEASVSGGALNAATGNNASVSGGRFNIASGQHSSVSGGSNRESSDTDDWRAGSLFQDD